MEIEFDPVKNKANLIKHGVDLALAELFKLETALVAVDIRKDYSETRYQAMGFIHARLHVMIFTLTPQSMRVISLRRANKREQTRYDKAEKTR